MDAELAAGISRACPLLCEDSIAHEREHSLEVQLPFLQVLCQSCTFVPIALGTIDFDQLVLIGEALGHILSTEQDVLLLTTSDFNHYEEDATTRSKDHLAIEKILQFDPRGLFDICRKKKISMCGLGPAVAMLTALEQLGAAHAELVKYATSADVTGDSSASSVTRWNPVSLARVSGAVPLKPVVQDSFPRRARLALPAVLVSSAQKEGPEIEALF